MDNKICIKCNEERTLDWFELRSDTKKYRNVCRICTANSKGHSSRKLQNLHKKDLLESGYKKCGKCNDIKELSNFHLDNNMSNKLTSWCKDCKKSYQVENKDNIRSSRLLKLYGIDINTYKDVLDRQNNKCEICSNELDEKNTHVDHCHTNGTFRGISCHYCNLMLGHAKDDIEILKSAIKYLESNGRD